VQVPSAVQTTRVALEMQFKRKVGLRPPLQVWLLKLHRCHHVVVVVVRQETPPMPLASVSLQVLWPSGRRFQGSLQVRKDLMCVSWVWSCE